MWPNPQETADLVTFNEEILQENFIFCAVLQTLVQNEILLIFFSKSNVFDPTLNNIKDVLVICKVTRREFTSLSILLKVKSLPFRSFRDSGFWYFSRVSLLQLDERRSRIWISGIPNPPSVLKESWPSLDSVKNTEIWYVLIHVLQKTKQIPEKSKGSLLELF